MGVGAVTTGSTGSGDIVVTDGDEAREEAAVAENAGGEAVGEEPVAAGGTEEPSDSSTDNPEPTAEAGTKNEETFLAGTADSDSEDPDPFRADDQRSSATTDDLDFEKPKDRQLLEDVRRNIQNANNAKELQEAAQPVLPAVDVVVEETEIEVKKKEEAQEKEENKKQRRLQQAIAKLPQPQLQILVKQIRAKVTELDAKAETAEEKQILKDIIESSSQLKETTDKKAESKNKSIFQLEAEDAEKTKKNLEALTAGLKNKDGKQNATKSNLKLSDYNERVKAAATGVAELQEAEKLAIQKDTPDALKDGVGGEKELTPKELRQLEKQRQYAEQRVLKEMAKAEKAAQETGEKRATTTDNQQQVAEQDVAKADPCEAVSIEHIAEMVVPGLIAKNKRVRAVFDRFKEEGKTDLEARMAIASGESFLASGTANADEAKLYGNSSAAFSRQMGRVLRFIGGKQNEDAQYEACTLAHASRLLCDGRSAVAHELVHQSNGREDGKFVASNSANQTHCRLSPEEMSKGYHVLISNSNGKMESDNEPGEVSESVLAQEFCQYWLHRHKDGVKLAGHFQAMHSDGKV